MPPKTQPARAKAQARSVGNKRAAVIAQPDPEPEPEPEQADVESSVEDDNEILSAGNSDAGDEVESLNEVDEAEANSDISEGDAQNADDEGASEVDENAEVRADAPQSEVPSKGMAGAISKLLHAQGKNSRVLAQSKSAAKKLQDRKDDKTDKACRLPQNLLMILIKI